MLSAIILTKSLMNLDSGVICMRMGTLSSISFADIVDIELHKYSSILTISALTFERL
jgi:hypothetical protein